MGRNVFYVGSKQEMALGGIYILHCALFSRAFNQLADADVYEQTFWGGSGLLKKKEILTYIDPLSEQWIQKGQALSSRPSKPARPSGGCGDGCD